MTDRATALFEKWCDLGQRVFRRDWIVNVFCLGLIGTLFLQHLAADPDLFARVSVGRLIELLGYLPARDPFSFTPKNPLWIDHEWLSGVVFYFFSQHGGDLSLFLLKTVVSFGTVVLLLRAASILEPKLIRYLPWLLLCLVNAVFVWMGTVRCQIFTYLFVAVTLYAFLLYREGSSKIWLYTLPFLMVLWCNLHGGFVLGLGLLFIFTTTLGVERLFGKGDVSPFPVLGCLLLSVAATAINPYGFTQYWHYMIEALSMPRPAISEWDPVMPWDQAGLALLILAGVCVIGLWRTRANYRATAAIFLVFGFLMAFRHLRLIPLAMMLCVVFGSGAYVEFCEVLRRKWSRLLMLMTRTGYGVGLAALIGFGVIFGKFVLSIGSFQLNYDFYPVQALSALRSSGATGNLLVDFNHGSFALWRLYPQILISVDGRYEEVYPESTNVLVGNAFKFGSAQANEALVRLNPDYILVPRDYPWAKEWNKSLPNWHEFYTDSSFSIITKSIIEGKGNGAITPIWKPQF